MAYMNIDELYSAYVKVVSEVAEEEVEEGAKDIMQQEAERIYEEYEPRNPEKRRMENEGFCDRRNIVSLGTKTTSKNITLRLRNITKGQSEKNSYLDMIIEQGGNPKGVPARPSYARTRVRIAKGELNGIMINGLKKRRWIK